MYGRYWPLGKDKGSNDNDKVAPAILKILSLSGGRGEKKKRQISSHLYQLSWPADLGINSRFHKPLANIPPLSAIRREWRNNSRMLSERRNITQASASSRRKDSV